VDHLSTLVSTGFQIGTTSLASSLSLSKYVLLAVDAILGNNETSKAVAAVALLVHRHYSGADTSSSDVGAERLGLSEFLVGTAGFALLQGWSRAQTRQTWQDEHVEEVIWRCPGHGPPKFHDSSLDDVCRYARFAIASYGNTYLSLTGSATAASAEPFVHGSAAGLPSHHGFSHYTDVPASSILLSSYIDSHGTPRPAAGDRGGGPDLPLTYYISLDHASRAVVLTCRGTLGFEDVLTDMICDSAALAWDGADHLVHRGILASARRLLTLRDACVPRTIGDALAAHPDYRLVLCGHSLGGGVATVLGLLLAQPHGDDTDSPYATASVSCAAVHIPADRPLHVYAYGPAATLSPALQLASRGLVTTIIHGADTVPALSLGNLADMQRVALAFRGGPGDAPDNSRDGGDDARTPLTLRTRVLAALRTRAARWSRAATLDAMLPPRWRALGTGGPEEPGWAWRELQALRRGMTAPKLVPGGRVYVIERGPRTDGGRDGAAGAGEADDVLSLTVTHVRDVAERFRELRVEGGMITDHLPVAYERVLQRLQRMAGELVDA